MNIIVEIEGTVALAIIGRIVWILFSSRELIWNNTSSFTLEFETVNQVELFKRRQF